MKLKHRSHKVFDVESEIVKAGNQPSPVDLGSFQKELTKIAGLDISGRPNLRVSWGQDPANRMIVCGSWRMKFPFWRNSVRHERINAATGLVEFWDELVEVGTPRFFVEELHTNAELSSRDRWENARWYWDGFERIDILGPIPDDGFYTAVFCIAYHDKLCCNGRGAVKGEPCLGGYREPCEEDLERCRRMKWLRDRAKNDDFAPSDQLIAKRTEDLVEKRDETWRKGIRGAIDDFMKTHSHTFHTLDPVAQQWGKFHFMGSHTKSGGTKDANNGNGSVSGGG